MTDGRYVSKKTLRDRVRPWVKPFWAKKLGKYAGYADTQYYVPPLQEVNQILKTMKLPSAQGELFNCDEFAFALKVHFSRYVRMSGKFGAPMAIGIAWARFSWISKGMQDHACNWVLDNTGTFFWIEPQNKKLYPAKRCRGRLNLLLV